MKTVEVVKTEKGWYVTRRYAGMNKGAEFFSTVPPLDMKKREAKKWLEGQEKAKLAYITAWTGE